MLKVLIAEDDRISRRILEKQVKNWGYDVISAENGDEAWEILQSDPIDLALLDWLMPEKSGIEICKSIRDQDDQRYTYIILLTSKTSQIDMNQGFSSGADDYITKPFNSMDLRARLKTGERIIDLQHKLYTQAICDDLTQILNRREIMRILDEEFERSLRTERELAAIMIDIDHFKRVNDSFGHTVGDQVLVEVASRLKNSIRIYDKIGRYGGEEFLVVLPDINLSQAKDVAIRLQGAMNKYPVETDAGHQSIRISLGCATSRHPEVQVPEDLLRISDQALYRAKEQGRNRIVTARAL